MSRRLVLPEGFRAAHGEGGTLIARAAGLAELDSLGLATPAGWESLLSGPSDGSGRGATARLRLDDGATLRLKRLRRGGLAAGLWRDRFPGPGRALRNLTVPIEAVSRGVRTPLPVALLLVPGPPGLFRAWLALEEVASAVDLRALVAAGDPRERDVREVMQFVRLMHDAGLEHRDLNLGNLLLRDGEAGAREVHVIDLDGARLHEGPLSFASRQRTLRRLERSLVKVTRERPVDPGFRDLWYRLYAGDDADLWRRLEKGRTSGRLGIALHRLHWRR